MTHETGQQRYRRLKADKLRHSQIAPSYTVAPVRCVCTHSRLMHDEPVLPREPRGCLSYGCDCTEYREQP